MGANDREKLLAFARGEATWAEVEGITAADAARMGRTGVELALGNGPADHAGPRSLLPARSTETLCTAWSLLLPSRS